MKAEPVVASRRAWAVRLRQGSEWNFLGIFWFESRAEPLPWQDGIRTALFRTRDQARDAIGGHYYEKRCVVVPVVVTIEELRKPRARRAGRK